ncbi:hypothetical protein BC940DRAFT_296816 [Gongronella butleri]|nr:hypothetical protein BC940DRAFT_296816 [Gongronella butleri]
MDSPIEVLRIEQNAVSKELNRFRACDPVTRCFYCREWALYIYKKHFAWNAKTQEDMQLDQEAQDMMSTGHYNICMLQHVGGYVKRKERSPKLSEQFEKLLEAKAREEDDDDDNDDNDDQEDHSGHESTTRMGQGSSQNSNTLTQDIIQACLLWQSLPSSLSGLPSIFEPVEFNPFPDFIPLEDDIKAPAQLLEPLIIERQALCLPSEGFYLLKNLTGDIFISHTQPTCHHIKPEDPTPTDLEVQRQILNEDLRSVIAKVLEAMDTRLLASWRPLLDFLHHLAQLEDRRNQLMGQQCQANVDDFVARQGLPSLAEVWQQAMTHNGSREERTKVIDAYLDDVAGHVRAFLHDFVNPRLVQIGKLIQDLWDLVGPTIQHMAERMACHEERDKGNAENCRAVSQSLKGLYSTKEVDEAIDRIKHAMAERVDEYIDLVHQVKALHTSAAGSTAATAPPSLSSSSGTPGIDSGLKKRLKRLDSGYASLRQFFRSEVTQKIFPETLFCKFTLVCLGALMQEGEVMEAMIIETEVKKFIESHRDLVKRRQALVLQFEDGVQVGRRELAGILGKLFLKEGMRIKGETLALKRQNMLLKSMGVGDTTTTASSSSSTTASSKKKKKKKKKTAATSKPSTPSLTATTTITTDDAPDSPVHDENSELTGLDDARNDQVEDDEEEMVDAAATTSAAAAAAAAPMPDSDAEKPPLVTKEPMTRTNNVSPRKKASAAKDDHPPSLPLPRSASSVTRPPPPASPASSASPTRPLPAESSSSPRNGSTTRASPRHSTSSAQSRTPPPPSPATTSRPHDLSPKKPARSVQHLPQPPSPPRQPKQPIPVEPKSSTSDTTTQIALLQQQMQQLQQEKREMHDAAELMRKDLAQAHDKIKEHEQQSRDQQQYIDHLESQLRHAQLSAQAPITAPASRLSLNSNHAWVTAGFGNQDLFEGIRYDIFDRRMNQS